MQRKVVRLLLHVALAFCCAFRFFGFLHEPNSKIEWQAGLGFIASFVIPLLHWLLSLKCWCCNGHPNVQHILFGCTIPILLLSSTVNDEGNTVKIPQTETSNVTGIKADDVFSIVFFVVSSLVIGIASFVYASINEDKSCKPCDPCQIFRTVAIAVSPLGYIIRIIHRFQTLGPHIPSAQIINIITAVACHRRDSSLCNCSGKISKDRDPHTRCGVLAIFISAILYGVVGCVICYMKGLSLYGFAVLFPVTAVVGFLECCSNDESKEKVVIFFQVALSVISLVYVAIHAHYGFRNQTQIDNQLGFVLGYVLN